jgi:hypothetical protein
MNDQIRNDQQIGIREIMDLLKNMPLPSSHVQWNKVIAIQVTDQGNLNYTWVLHEGNWDILEERTQKQDITLCGRESEFVHTFTEKLDTSVLPKPALNFKDAAKLGALIGKIQLHLRNLSPQLITEAKQRQMETQATKAKTEDTQIKPPTITPAPVQKCKNCGRDISAGKVYHFYFGPDLGRNQYKHNNGAYITTETVVGTKVDGVASVYICHRCVLRFVTKHNWPVIYLALMTLGWPTMAFLLYTTFTSHGAPPNFGFIMVLTATLLALISIIWGIRLRLRSKAKLKALEEASDADLEKMMEKKVSDPGQDLDYNGDIFAIRIGSSEVAGKKSSTGKHGYYYLTRRKYRLFVEGKSVTELQAIL